MNVYRISYQAALDGEYQKKIDRYAPFGRYFDQLRARVYLKYADTDLQIGSDHLQNLVNLIYSGRKYGIDEIELALDHQAAQEESIEHFYAILFLPAVVARLEQDKEQMKLLIAFDEGKNTSSCRATTPNPDDFDDVDQMLDEAKQRNVDEKKQPFYEQDPFSVGMRALVETLKTDSRRKVELPQWVIEKYKLKDIRTDCSKTWADIISGLTDVFREVERRAAQVEKSGKA